MLIPLFLLLGSFNAIAVQLVLVRILEDFIHHEIFSYTLVFVPHFFALGLAARRSPPASLLSTELRLSAESFLWPTLFLWAPLLILPHLLGESGSPFVDSRYYALSLPLAAAISFRLSLLHGLELPWVVNNTKSSLGAALFASYLGALLAYLTVPHWLLPVLGYAKLLLLISSGSLVVAGLSLRFTQARLSPLRGLFIVLLIGSLGFAGHFLHFKEPARRVLFYVDGLENWPDPPLQNVTEAWRHIQNRIHVETVQTPLQTIDWVSYRQTLLTSFRLYLNGEFQFDSLTEEQYHDGFLSGLEPEFFLKPLNVLVVGAGDGLLARTLFKRLHVQTTLTLVELDAKMLELAQNHSQFKQLNQAALSNPRLLSVVEDGFFYLKNCHSRFDAIFIDLPYPSSFALSRVYSEEFYKFARACLKSEEAPLILDAPLEGRFGQIMASTLESAGFSHSFFYGQGNTYILASNVVRTKTQMQLKEKGLLLKTPESSKHLINRLSRPTLPDLN